MLLNTKIYQICDFERKKRDENSKLPNSDWSGKGELVNSWEWAGYPLLKIPSQNCLQYQTPFGISNAIQLTVGIDGAEHVNKKFYCFLHVQKASGSNRSKKVVVFSTKSCGQALDPSLPQWYVPPKTTTFYITPYPP